MKWDVGQTTGNPRLLCVMCPHLHSIIISRSSYCTSTCSVPSKHKTPARQGEADCVYIKDAWCSNVVDTFKYLDVCSICVHEGLQLFTVKTCVVKLQINYIDTLNMKFSELFYASNCVDMSCYLSNQVRA